MKPATRTKAAASSDAAPTSRTEAEAGRVEPAGAASRQTEARRRWIGVATAALALLFALLAQWISARTALMLGGSLLAFAMLAERLYPLEN